MKLARVVRKVVCTVKNRAFAGRPLLLVQPVDLTMKKQGAEVLCIDFMGASEGEMVLIMQEGSAINQLLGSSEAPADAGIIGIVDTVTLHDQTVYDMATDLI